MPNRAPGQGPSLKARAVAYLSRREHSRFELQQKLAAWCDDQAAIQAVLDQLQHENWQSDQRYAQALAHRNAARHGLARIAQELRHKGVADHLISPVINELRQSEFARAQAVWQRRFGQSAADAREYARQYRFMAGRGFAADTIRQVLKSAAEPHEPSDTP